MPDNTLPYHPAEDSHLLAAAVREFASGTVLDMGTGSGIHAITAAKKKEVTSVVAADISSEALKFAEAVAKAEGAKKIRFIKSDLFRGIKARFDTIIFNPPYLPQDKGITDATIYGGRHGHEVLERFLGGCAEHLTDKGIVLILFSSLTNKQKVDEIIAANCLKAEEADRQHLLFEDIYVYKLRKSALLLKLQERGIKGISLFARGNRGLLYKGRYRGKEIIVKAKQPDTTAVATIENEIAWLKVLNRKSIGPKVLFNEKDWFAYEFVRGKFIIECIMQGSKKETRAILKQLLAQCRALDKMRVNKEELSRPQKHVLINRGRVTMIDFERCRKTLRPKNITQLCQFLAGGHATGLLEEKGIRVDRSALLAAAQRYKNRQTDENFKKIEREVRGEGK